MTFYKKSLCIFLSVALVLMGSGCAETNSQQESSTVQEPIVEQTNADEVSVSVLDLPVVQTENVEYSELSDPDLLEYIEDAVYLQTIQELNSEDYVVEDVRAIYVSKEYLDELEYNSKSNIYFGFTLDELESYYQGEKYIFTLGEDGQTVTKAFVGNEDDTFSQVVKNVAIGGGVILVCVTISAVTAGAGMPAAVNVIFAAAAKTGTTVALSSGAMAAFSAGVITAFETGDFNEALKQAALSGSEGFKYGAIVGALSGGLSEAFNLYQMTASGLSMNEVAAIQRESNYPPEIISQLENMEQYQILKDSGCYTRMVDNRYAVVQDIDLNYVDEMGRTNLERMRKGLAPLDPQGNKYELHHIGQHQDSPLAILTQEEHRGKGNYSILHKLTESEIDHEEFAKPRRAFWKSMYELLSQTLAA